MILKDEKLLRATSDAVESYEEGKRIADELIAEVTKIGGFERALGLSAPQIGIFKRVFIAWGSTGESNTEGWNVYINPTLEETIGDDRLFFEEGCLSFPGVTVNTNRNSQIGISTLEEDGTRQRYVLLDRDAIVFQHELDHLDGVLFFDRVAKSVPQPAQKKVGRNELCPCGSGLKFKRCHGR